MLTIREKLLFAMLNNRLIQFNYRKINGESGARTGEPYEIRTTKSGNELLVLWDLRRNSWRCFRLEAIKGVKILNISFISRRGDYQAVI